jgi:hypothetical protein
MYGQLTSDVPLGPFEGTTITVWSCQGKQAKLHATPSCSYLRSARGESSDAGPSASRQPPPENEHTTQYS